MNRRVAILVSPGALDGYPPVQNQARVLADAGFRVEIVTLPRFPDGELIFSHPNVHVHVVRPVAIPVVQRAWRMTAFVHTIGRLRSHHRASPVVEIAYDPLGVWYSDLAARRPAIRIAHFHETLDEGRQVPIFLRLPQAVRSYQKIVAPDVLRAEHLREVLQLPFTPLVVPNYPLLNSDAHELSTSKSKRFEIIYSGALGRDQQIHNIAESVAQWPEAADLVLLGDRSAPMIRDVLATVPPSRVRVEGWVPFEALVQRLASAWLGISLLDPARLVWRTALGASNKRYLYMQAGLPQIGDMNPGVSDLLEGSDIGRCVTSFSPAEIAAIVRTYEADRNRCLREGERARTLVRERYNYQAGMQPLLAWIDAHVPRGLDASGQMTWRARG